MSTLDIILLICFVPALVQGIRKGLVEQAVGIASIFLGAWLAYLFSSELGEWLTGFINLDPKYLGVLSFAIIVILTVLLLSLAGRLLTKTLSLACLGWLDRLLGVVFSLLKAALVIGLIIFVVDTMNDKWSLINPETLNGSQVYCALRDASLKVFPYLQNLIENVQ